uniref:Uncharacterized protein n=1 Tax=Fagus sylvatica TaxID=28930 RepID=A0A2N9J470_FAGSY
MSRTSKSRGSRLGSSSSNPTSVSNLPPLDAKLGAKKWNVAYFNVRNPKWLIVGVMPLGFVTGGNYSMLRPRPWSSWLALGPWWRTWSILVPKVHGPLAVSEVVGHYPHLPYSWSQDTPDEQLLMARAFLMYLLGNTIMCNSSQTMFVKWLHFFEDLDTIAEYNWGGLALAHLYVNMDSVSLGITTSLMGYWQLWEVRLGFAPWLCEDFPEADWHNNYTTWNHLDRITKDWIAWTPWELLEERMEEGLTVAWHLSWLERHPFTSGSVTLGHSDGLLVETSVSRREGVYGLLIPADCRPANNADLHILLPQKRRRALDILDECLGVPYSLGRTWLKDRVDFRALVEYFKDKRDNEHYHYALMVAVLAGFFLVGNFEAIDPKIVNIVEMLGTGNSAPMILAETLNGLDDLKDGTCHHFKRNPLLLQIVPKDFCHDFSRNISQKRVDKIASTWKECVRYTRQEGTKRTDPGGLYEGWVMCDME